MRTVFLLLVVAGLIGFGGTSALGGAVGQGEPSGVLVSPTVPAPGEGTLLSGQGTLATTLLDLGHVQQIDRLEESGDRVLSVGGSRWILWDRVTRTQVLDGAASTMITVRLVGSTLLVVTNGAPWILELRSALDGQLLTSLQFDIIGPWPTAGLTSDGLHAWAADSGGISVWDLFGQHIASAAGDYSRAQVFASVSELRIARSPSHQDAIEVLDFSSGKISVTPSFSGTFHSWFLDGDKFFTNISNVVWIYSRSATQLEIISLPEIQSLTGQGDYFWDTTLFSLDIYRVGGGPNPEISYPFIWGANHAIGVGNKIGVLLSGGPTEFDIISLDPSGVTRTSHEVPMANLTAFGADDDNWVVGNYHGVILESSSWLPFGYGEVWSIAGAETGTAAVATASGEILMFGAQSAGPISIGSIDFASSHVELSGDGNVLAAKGNTNDYQYWPDRSVKVFAIPELIEIAKWHHDWSEYPTLFVDFGLSRSGDHLAHLEQTYNGFSWTYSRMLTDIQGEVIYFSDSSSRDFDIYRLSPDGRRFALNTENGRVALIYEDGELVSAVDGAGIGWLDDERILACSHNAVNIYDSRGTLLITTPLYCNPAPGYLLSFNVVSPTRILVTRGPPLPHTIYDLETGAVVWSRPSASRSAVAGPFIIYATYGGQLIAEQYPQ